MHISVLAYMLKILTKLVIQKDTMTYTCQVAERQGLELNLAINWLEITDQEFDSVHMFHL